MIGPQWASMLGDGLFREDGSPSAGRRFTDEGLIGAGVECGYPFLALRLFHFAHVGGRTSFDGLVDALWIRIEAHELGHTRQFALLIRLQIFVSHQDEALVSLARRQPTIDVVGPGTDAAPELAVHPA